MLESLYYICAGPVLVLVALIALQQIGAIRKQTEQSERQHRQLLARDADRLAGELVDRYLLEVEPPSRRLVADMLRLRREKWDDLWDTGPYFEWDDIPVSAEIRSHFGIQLTSIVDPDQGADALNNLETICLRFNRELASDETGKLLLHEPITQLVETLWPLIALVRSRAPRAYDEIITLYKRWGRSGQVALESTGLTPASSRRHKR